MPPTVAAATKTASGRFFASHVSVASCRRRSSSLRLAPNSVHLARWSRRIKALPTIPWWPATKTRRPASGKITGASVIGLALSRRSGAARGRGVARGLERTLLLREAEIMLGHHADELGKADARAPAEPLARLAGIALERVDLGRPQIARIELDMLLPVEPKLAERRFDKLANAVRFACRDRVVIGLLLLQHQPHRLDIVA